MTDGNNGLLHRVTRGRLLRRGMTWWSALLVLASIIGLFIGLGALLRQQATEYFLDSTVLERQVAVTDDGCELRWQIRVENPNELRVSLVSFSIDAVDDSTRRILGSIESLGSIEREYRLPLDDCADAPDDGPIELTTAFKLTGTSRERTVTTIVD